MAGLTMLLRTFLEQSLHVGNRQIQGKSADNKVKLWVERNQRIPGNQGKESGQLESPIGAESREPRSRKFLGQFRQS